MANGDVRFQIKATDKTKAAFDSVQSGLKSVYGKVFSLQGAVAALAGTAGFGALIISAAKTADATAKAADRLRISTQALAGLQYASSLAGVETNKFNGYLAHMEKSIGQAATQGGQMAAVLEQTGLNIQQLNAMNPHQQFLALSDAINHMGSATQRSYVEATLFSDATNEMLNVMATGRGHIEALTREAERFGVAISRADASKIEAANDSFTRLGYAVKGLATTIAVDLSPYVSVLANRLADATKQGNGFKTQIFQGVEQVTLAVAKMADVWRGLEVTWKLLEVAFAEYAKGVWAWWDMTFGNIFRALSHLPEIGDKFRAVADVIGYASQDASQRAARLSGELSKLAMEPMPSDSVQQFFDSIRKEADKTAQKVAAVTQQNNAQLAGAPAAQQQDPQLAARLQQLMDSTKSEHQLLEEKYQDQQFLLDDALNNNLISYQTYQEQLQAIELQHQAKMSSIEARGILQRRHFEESNTRQRVAFVFGQLAQMTQGVAQNNKTMFEINKVAAIANAIINTYQGVTLALASYPPPVSFAMAAIQLAAGLAQVSAIRSQSFGDGAASPSLTGQGGGTSTINAVPVGATNSTQVTNDQQSQSSKEQKIFNITISGNPTGQQIRDLIESINQEVGDGAQLHATTIG